MASDDVYPIILIPQSLERVKTLKPDIPRFEGISPILSGDPPKPESKVRICAEISTVGVSGGFFALKPKTRSIGIGILFAGSVAIAVSAYRRFKKYRSLQLSYEKKSGRYQNELENFKIEKQRHDEQYRALQTPEYIQGYQRELTLDALSQTISVDGSNSTAKCGHSEQAFHDHLRRYFNGNILIRQWLKIPGFHKPYTPDFSFVDRETGLHIDIEIDEPYVFESGKPIHFIEADKDKKRDQFFLNKGWLVIRFSEEQAVRWPGSCCKVVACEISSIMDTDTPIALRQVPDLNPQPRWSKNEAVKMAETRYRHNYLVGK